RAGCNLQNAPGRRIDCFEDADPLHAQAEGREEERKNAPAHAVVEVVEESGLRGGEEIAITESGQRKNFPKAHCSSFMWSVANFRTNVGARVADEKYGEQRARNRVADAQIDRHWPQPIL